MFHVDEGSVTDPQNAEAIDAALDQLRDGHDVTAVSDPFDARGPTISADGRTAFASVNYSIDPLESEHAEEAEAAAETARERGVQTELTGTLVHREIHGSEHIGLAVAVIVLLLAFGSMIAMAIPIVTALIGLVIGLGGVGIMASFVDTPVTSTMIASMIGLGVGIDYALFVVTRHRQHLHEGMSVEDAAGIANATAGQSVLFAGMTVVIAITGLVMAGLPAITAMGFAAAIVVLFSMFIAVTLLPACLGLAGRHIDRWSIPHRKDRAGEAHQTFVRPVGPPRRQAPVALRPAQPHRPAGVGRPGRQAARWASPTTPTPVTTTTQHKAYDLLTDNFGQGFNGPLMIVVDLAEAPIRRHWPRSAKPSRPTPVSPPCSRR